jgi:hypothetical protein
MKFNAVTTQIQYFDVALPPRIEVTAHATHATSEA